MVCKTIWWSPKKEEEEKGKSHGSIEKNRNQKLFEFWSFELRNK